jgi:hypothetical protein
MPRRKEVRRHPSLPPVSQAEPTVKPASVTAVIRRLVIADQTANAKALEVRLVEASFNGTKLSTIATIRADTLATLREAAALGLLRTAEDSSQLEFALRGPHGHAHGLGSKPSLSRLKPLQPDIG